MSKSERHLHNECVRPTFCCSIHHLTRPSPHETSQSACRPSGILHTILPSTSTEVYKSARCALSDGPTLSTSISPTCLSNSRLQKRHNSQSPSRCRSYPQSFGSIYTPTSKPQRPQSMAEISETSPSRRLRVVLCASYFEGQTTPTLLLHALATTCASRCSDIYSGTRPSTFSRTLT